MSTSTSTTSVAAAPPHSPRLPVWLVGLAILPALALLFCIGATLVAGMILPFSAVLLAGVLLVASFTDLRERKIPNWLTYSALLWGLLLNGSYSLLHTPPLLGPDALQERLGAVGLPDALLGAACCFAVMLVGYLASGTGAGDVKLLAAVGAIAGVSDGFSTLLWGYIAAGAAILLSRILTGDFLTLVGALGRRIGAHFAPSWIDPPAREQTLLLDRPFPLAAAFAVGALITAGGGAFFTGGAA